MTSKFLVIIPSYNEEANLPSLIEELNVENTEKSNIKLEFLIVNDCSTDDTLNIIKNINCNYINLPVNLGIGGAVQTGFKYAINNNFEFSIQVDGDGQHPPTEIFKLIDTIEKEKADIVIGSRYITKQGYQSSRSRRAGIFIISSIIKLLTNLKISDPTSGFRIYNKKAMFHAIKEYPDEYPEPQFLIIANKAGLKIKEIPLIMRERNGGISSISASRSAYYVLKVVISIIYAFIKSK